MDWNTGRVSVNSDGYGGYVGSLVKAASRVRAQTQHNRGTITGPRGPYNSNGSSGVRVVPWWILNMALVTMGLALLTWTIGSNLERGERNTERLQEVHKDVQANGAQLREIARKIRW